MQTTSKVFKSITLITISSLCLTINSGCWFSPKNYFSKSTNLGGIFTHEPNSYSPVETGTIRLGSDDLVNRQNHKGGKTSILWGLFTYTDY